MSNRNWYDNLYDDTDDALLRGLKMLEDLRGALPKEKEGAVDEAKEMLCRAAKLYKDMQKKAASLPPENQ